MRSVDGEAIASADVSLVLQQQPDDRCGVLSSRREDQWSVAEFRGDVHRRSLLKEVPRFLQVRRGVVEGGGALLVLHVDVGTRFNQEAEATGVGQERRVHQRRPASIVTRVDLAGGFSEMCRNGLGVSPSNRFAQARRHPGRWCLGLRLAKH